MIIVDTSVWIDYFNGSITVETDQLDNLLGRQLIGLGDLILTEILQGFRSDRDFDKARKFFNNLAVYEMLNRDYAVKSAANFRILRKKGVTVRKTADVIIATFCLENNHRLLFSDKDFMPFVEHFGLKIP